MSADFRVISADWQHDLAALRSIRGIVFVREQSVPIELEWADLDADCDHVLAVDAGDRPIGTGRLAPDHAIGRMAVLPAWRGKGVGAAMLLALIERARTHGWAEVTLHAQVHAIDFYQRHGFRAHGEAFMEAGIRHRHMALKLLP